MVNNELSALLPTNRNHRNVKPTGLMLSFFGGISCFIAVAAALLSCMIVGPGEVAVVVTFGHVTTMEPGFHLITPIFARVHMMSTKTQLLDQENTIPTKEGLSVRLETAMYV